MEYEFLESTRRQSGQGAEGMTDEEIERFALVLKECERIRTLIAREEAALSKPDRQRVYPPIVAQGPAFGRLLSRPVYDPELLLCPFGLAL